MIKLKITSIYLLLCFNLLTQSSCAIFSKPLFSRYDVSTKNYILGEVKTVHLGLPVISYQEGETRLAKKWVGLDKSPSGFQEIREQSDWYYKQEIIFQGAFDGRLSFFYKEYIDNVYSARGDNIPILLNLKDAKTLRFKRFLIEILDAQPQEVTYRVLSDSET
jgi:hypothetical protein